MIELDYVTPECTCRWERRGTYWRCDTCHMVSNHAQNPRGHSPEEVRAGELLREVVESGEPPSSSR